MLTLERIIKHLDTLYELGEETTHPDTGRVVSDGEYDAMRRELFRINPDSPIFETPTSSDVEVSKKITHNPPMTSISKASHEDVEVQTQQLEKWKTDSQTSDFSMCYKLDGVALALYYENGVLIGAGLRPRDGVNGEDVTEQVRYVSGVPSTLPVPVTCSIRGELICKKSDFDKVQQWLMDNGEKVRANPRNHTAGGIRQFKEPKKVANMRLSFIAYSVVNLDDQEFKTEIERASWVRDKLGIPFVDVVPLGDLSEMENNAADLDYEVDGIVISVNNLEDQEQLGRHGDTESGNPRGKIAWKFSEERATPKINEIEWSTGRTGAIKPVAIFDAVQLAGTSVQRATLHNLGFIYRNGIAVGTKIIVLKAGKIIPKVIGVESDGKTYQSVEEIDVPKSCPTCGHDSTIRNNNEQYELFCYNKSCSAQNVAGCVHFLSTIGVMGLGESRVETLIPKVKSFADFFKLTVDDAMSCGLTHRQAELAVAAIHFIPSPEKKKSLKSPIDKAIKAKKKIPAWKLFASFGIESAGKSCGKALMEHFGSFDKVRNASVEELNEVPDVGEKTAKIIFDYFRDNEQQVNEILNFVDAEVKNVSGKFSGLTFVFTGGFPEGKTFWQQEVEKLGGKVSNSVSKKTNYVVVGSDAGSKAEKAVSLGITTLTSQQLNEMVSE